MSPNQMPWHIRLRAYQRAAELFVTPVQVRLMKTLTHNRLPEHGGETYWNGERFVIELVEGLPPTEESRLLFHELGHIKQGHVPKVVPQPVKRLDVLRQGLAIRGELVPKAQAEYDRREREADAWGNAARARFVQERLIW